MNTATNRNPRLTADGKLDAARVREDFPILGQLIYGGKRLAYLDNAATTQKPAAVVCALCDYYQAFNANVHRSLHYLAEQATIRFEEARKKVARFIGASTEKSIVFTRGTTEAINLVAAAWGRANIRAGDEILLTEMEHHSNLVPWQQLANEKGALLRFVPVLPDGTLDRDAFRRHLSPRVKLFAFAHISNVLGTVNPARELIREAHAAGIVVLLDAAQSVPHRPVNAAELDCDFLAFSGHKMLAPTGIGALYGRPSILEKMEPFMFGGEMINRVDLDRATWADVPQRFEAGTPDISGAIGLGIAVDYLQALGMERVADYEHELTTHTLDVLRSVPGVKVFGAAVSRGGAVSFEVEGVHPHDLAQFVDREGVAIRAGHLCAQPLMRKLGVPAVSRASAYLYNVPEEIDRLGEAIRGARKYFGHGTG